MSLTLGSDPRTLLVAEPPAQYLIRPPIVIDCSVLADLVFGESWHLQVIEKIQRRALHAPCLLQAEIVSVALKKHKKSVGDLAEKASLMTHRCPSNCTASIPPTHLPWLCATTCRLTMPATSGWPLNLKHRWPRLMKSWLPQRRSIWPARLEILGGKLLNHHRHPLRQRTHQLVADSTARMRYFVD